MLKQNSDAQEPPAAEMRVKKEEFARAITALEARRQAEAQQQEGTVVIGDVLQQLQINLPAEEVLQEIQAIHTRQPHDQEVRRPLWNADQKSTAKLVAGITLVPLAAIAIGAIAFNPLHSPTNSPKQAAMTSVSSSFPFWMMPTSPNIPAGTTGEVMDEGGFNASSVLKPLSAVPDNQPVHCTTASLNQLCNTFTRSLMSKPITSSSSIRKLDSSALAQSSQLFDIRPNLHKPWTLIKHDGKLYLRGWVAARFTEAQAQHHAVTVHSSEHSFDLGVKPEAITLPMSFVQYSGDGPGPQAPTFYSATQPPQLTARQVVLDGHAWEKW